MEIYGKVFKKYFENDLHILYNEYLPDKQKYYRLIEESLDRGERQVIINSEIMIQIMYEVIKDNGVVLDIKMSASTDKIIKENVRDILWKIRENNIEFVKLKELLEWSNSKDSIDIMSIDIYYQDIRYTITSHGIFYSTNNQVDLINVFNDLLKNNIKNLIV